MTPTDPRSRKSAPLVPTDSHAYDRYHAEHGHAEHDGLYNEDVAHEHSDVNVRALLLFCGGLVLVAVIVHVAMWGLFMVFERQAVQNDPVMSPLAVPAGQLPPEPRLLTDEPLNLQAIRAEETQVLQQYGWVDEKSGVARIPIDEAKKRLLHDGLPVRPEGPVEPWMGTRAATRGEASSGRTIPLRPGAAQPERPAPPPGDQPAGRKPPGGGGH